MTNPEQSNPDGEAPPHTYGTPRYLIAMPTTPPPWLDGGGAADAPLSLEATRVSTDAACAAGGLAARRARACRSSAACLARSRAWICLISVWIDARRAWRDCSFRCTALRCAAFSATMRLCAAC